MPAFRDSGLSLSLRRGAFAALAVLFLAAAFLPQSASAQMTLTGSVSPKPVSYIGTLTYSASASGGDPATTQYAFFRRRPGGTWIPSVSSPSWQASGVFRWYPTINDVGTWETYIWAKDGNTPANQNTYGYAAGYNTMPVDVIGPPTAPGPTTVSCDYAPSGQCWVAGDFVVSVSASSGGLGSLSYQICRSNDTSGWGGCDVNLTLNGGTSMTVSGSHLPADGYQRAYYFQARDSAGAYSGWNTPKYVRVDRYAPAVSATNAADYTWYSYRTATVSASDSGSGVQSVRYSWNSAHNSSCTTGTATSSGATLTAPAGDNVLYLCAKDNTGRVGQWSGRYRVSPLGLTGSISPTTGSYLGSFTWTASASGGTPSTTRYAFFRRRPGGTWIPDVNAPAWQAGNTSTWYPTSSDTGTWETYIWVKDGDTPSSMNTYGYAAGYNTMPITVQGPPTVPGPTTAACAYTASGECWVQGDFTASATASTGGTGGIVYQICRSVDTTGFGGCDVNLTLSGGTSILVSGTHLPADGYRRAYYFQAKDSAGAYSGWNTPLYVRVDRYAPAVSATNASDVDWYSSRTATVSASDAHSGLQSVRYSWNAALDAACTTGTATSSGAVLTAPVGDNTLYLCARDNTGRVGQWSGRYRVSAPLTVTSCSVSPPSGSYTGGFTYTATVSGGIPSTIQYAFFHRIPGGTWVPAVSAPVWQAGNTYTWMPGSTEAGTWETYVWVKDRDTPPSMNTYGYAAGCNPGPITVAGPPTKPGATTVACAYTASGDCWVQGDFTASAAASTGGTGGIVYQICRSNDKAAGVFGGCEVNLTLSGGTSILVSGANLPSDGYRRAYYFQAKDSAGALSGWNTPLYVWVDRYAPTVGASNASDTVSYSYRAATVSASDSGSGLQAVRYSWNTALDAGCTTGTATSSGAALTAPAGDNLLYLCARDNTGRVGQWSGRYKVSPLTLTGTVAPKPASYLATVTYTATATGGAPATTQYAFFRRQGAGAWIPDVSAPNWQPGNTFTWNPTINDVGTWETYIWVRDADTPAGMNGYGYAAGFNTGPIDIAGKPTVPGATTVACAYATAEDCWVQGDFTASATASTGGLGSLVYQICRSNDSTGGFAGCDVNLTLSGGTSILVAGTNLPSDGYRRAYYFQAKDSAGALSGWNTPRYVRVDRQAPAVSASNASDQWFNSRTATVTASDEQGGAAANSGLGALKYSWNAGFGQGCAGGTSVASGAVLTAPAGDNLLYLCAVDNVGRQVVWTGRYRVAESLLLTGTVSPDRTSWGNTFTWRATAVGGVPASTVYAFFRRRPGGTWIPDVSNPVWQAANTFTWTPAEADLGTWETYIWVKDATTPPDANGYGYAAGYNTGPIEVLPALTLTASRSPYQSTAGETLTWTAFADGGVPETRQFALFRRRPGGTWMPDVNAPDWQPGNLLTWTPSAGELGVWETYIWVKDGTTPADRNTYGYAAGFNPGPVEIVAPVAPDFALELTPPALTVVRGGSVRYTLAITGNSTFTGTAALSVSGLPPATSHTLEPDVIAVGDTATLTLSTAADTPPGTYDLTVTAVAGDLTRPAAAGLTVTLPAATGAPVIDSISPESFDGGVVKTVTLTGRNFQGSTLTVATENPDPDDPKSRVFPALGQMTISPDGTRIDVEVDCTAPGVMDFYELVVDNGVGKDASHPFRVIPVGPVVDLVTPSKPERGEDNVYVLTLGGYHLRNATVRIEPAGALVVFGVDAVDDSHINGLLRVPNDAPLGTAFLVVTGSGGHETRVEIEIVGAGAAMVATQRLGTRRVDPLTFRPMEGSSPSVLFQRFAVRDPEATEVTEQGMRVRTATSLKKLRSDSFTFQIYYQYTLNLLNFSWTRAFVFDPLTGRIGDEILKNLGLGDKIRFGAFVLSFALRVDLTIEVYITNTGFTWPRFCFVITTAIQIPGTDGFYEQWSYCRGGRWFSFRGGSTDSLTATGGPCAEVTPEGPPADGLLYAQAEQTGCCSQPVEVSGAGFSRVTGRFNVTTQQAGATTPGPSCTCSVSTPPACILKGQQQTLTAQGQPSGGTYQWRVVQGSDRVSIKSGANSYSMVLEGTNTSEAADDVQLEMVYTNGTDSCSQLVDLSIVEIASPEFSAGDQADTNNAVRNQPELGLPQLGPVTPGNPPATTGFHKNMQIKAEIFPCDPNLRCKFDFKRVKQGVGVFLDANGKVTGYGAGHCPNGFCNDDPGNLSDEDLRVDPYPGCSIYVVDSPGVIVGNTNAACQGYNGTTIVTCFTFDEWLQVDGRQDVSTSLKWHAASRIRCNGTSWVLDNGGAGNRIGLGYSPIDCAPGTAYSVTPPLASATPALSAKTAMESVEVLADPEMSVRSGAYDALLRKAQRAGLEGEERAEVVSALVQMAGKRGGSEFQSAPLLAIGLLGELRAAEAVPVLLDRLLDELPRPMDSDADFATPAAQALAKIGAPAMAPLLDLAATADEREWLMAKASLELMHQPGRLRQAVTARLAAAREGLERERLQEVLDIAERQ